MKQVGGEHYERVSVQPWEIIRRNELDYWEGNVLKYLLRHKLKGGLQDLLKAKHYLEYTIEHYDQLYRSENVQNQSSQRQSAEQSPRDLSDLYRGANGLAFVPAEAPGRAFPPLDAPPGVPR